MNNAFAFFFFSSLAFGGLGYAQTLCDADSATSFSLPRGSCSNDGSSSGDVGDASSVGLHSSTIGTEGASNLVSPPRKRQLDLSCTSNEACRIIGQTSLMCYNEQTADFHAPDGTTGNVITGNYILSDGQKGNIYCDLEATLAGASSSIAVPASSKQQATNTASLITPAATTSLSSAVPTHNLASSSSSSQNTLSTSSSSSAVQQTNNAESAASSSLQSLFHNNNIFTVVLTSMVMVGSVFWEIFRF